MDGTKTTPTVRGRKKRLQLRLAGESSQSQPGGVHKTSPRKPVPGKKAKPPLKVGDPIKCVNGNRWSRGAVVIAIGTAIIVCRDVQGFTFTRPKPDYEFPRS